MIPSSSPEMAVRFSAYDAPPLYAAQDVTVVPSTAVIQGVPNGGPVLDDPVLAKAARHSRGAVPVGEAPQGQHEDYPHLDESFIWGGYASGDWADMAGEFCARILAARAHRPEDRILFVGWPGVASSALPDRVWEILAWLDVPRDQTIVVETPVRVTELWIGAQAEQAAAVGPSYHYLELLAQNTTRRALVPAPIDVTFVPRRSLDAAGGTLCLGETYLASCLTQAGVHVLDVEATPLDDVLRVFAGSAALVFSEGRATRLRQVLGYYEQSITILPRQLDSRPALHSLMPRAREIAFADTTTGMLALIRNNGRPDRAGGMTVYDEDDLLNFFEALGVPLRAHWDSEAWAARCRDELRLWLEQSFGDPEMGESGYDRKKSINQVRRKLQRFNLQAFEADLDAIVNPPDPEAKPLADAQPDVDIPPAASDRDDA